MNGPGAAARPEREALWWLLRAHWAIGPALFFLLTEASRPALLAAAATFALGTALDRRGPRSAAWHRAGAPLIVGVAAAAILDFAFRGGDLLSSLTILVLGTQSVKLLLPKSAADGWQLCAISFLEFLAAAAVTDDVRFALFILLYIFLSVGAMWELHLQGAAAPAARPAPRFAARLILLAGAAGALLTAILFVLTPRVGIGQLLHRPGRPSGISGFSNTITLRDVTAIKADRRVVARIEFPGSGEQGPPGNLYLRGVGYAIFDGKSWARRGPADSPVPRAGFHYSLGPMPPAGAPLVVADVMLEQMDYPTVFVYPNPVELEGGFGTIRADRDGNFEFLQERHGGGRYRLLYSPVAPRPGRDRGPGPGYLELPPGSDVVRRVAEEVTAGAGTPAERLERLERYFRKGFRYSLADLPRSVDEFLLARRGHCEHFATALCLMLRAAGVPARVAAGYLGGEWSDVGHYLIVRQSDAHAWTEAWIDGAWATVDATPPLGEDSPFISRTGLVGIYLDWAKERWDKYVVNYSLRTQADSVFAGWKALRSIRSGVSGRLSSWGGAGRRAVPGAAVVLFGAALLTVALAFVGARRSRRAPAGGVPSPPLPAPYAALLRALERCGYRRTPGTTPERMIRDAAARGAIAPGDAVRFLSLYHRDRFGGTALPPRERAEAERLAAGLRAALSRRGAA